MSKPIGKPSLTPRQQEVLLLIAEGLSAKEMAHRTGVSQKTIEFHKAALYDRLGMRSTAALVRYALRNGLIQDADVGPLPKFFKVVYYCDEMEGTMALAHVRATYKTEATKKLHARFGHLRGFKIHGVTEADGVFIVD